MEPELRPSTRIRYVTPSVARKATRLVVTAPPALSFAATLTSEARSAPVYTASTVSKSLPRVSIVAAPVYGAVHEYQSEACAYPPLAGSAPSRVAAPFSAVADASSPDSG